MYKWTVTISAQRVGYAMTYGSNAATRCEAFRAAKRYWRAAAPVWAQCDVTSASVLSATELALQEAMRPSPVGFAAPRLAYLGSEESSHV